ncbi:MAG TPA: hypothetical protein ENI73_10445 [Spirochaetes bacterium]|nr:hypothetical protein [Spirochaetota bacterium]
MKRLFITLFMTGFMLILVGQSWATNGAQLIGVGPISRSMGGTGIANPQSATSAVYLNPGSMIFVERIDFGGSIFMPDANTTVGGVSGDSQEKIFLMPAIGMIMHPKEWLAMGMSLVQVVGMGTDYRTTPVSSVGRLQINQTDFIFAGALKLMKDKLGIGLSVPISYQEVDTGTGISSDIGIAVKIGIAYEISSKSANEQSKLLRGGAYFKTPPLLTPKHSLAGLNKLGAPAEIGLGVSLIAIKKLILSFDGKYILWDSAKGYGDSSGGFDWKNQFVFGFGAQLGGNAEDLLLGWFILRAGYNYGSKVVQNNAFFSLPALVKHHFSLGFSVEIGPAMHMNVGGVLGIKESRSAGTNNSAELKTWSLEMGISGIFS